MKTILAAAALAVSTFAAVGCAAPTDDDADAQDSHATQRVELGTAHSLALAPGLGSVRVLGECSRKDGTTNQYVCTNDGYGSSSALFDGVGVSQSVSFTNEGKVAVHVMRSGGRLNMTSYVAPGATVTMEGDERFGGMFILRTSERAGSVRLIATIH